MAMGLPEDQKPIRGLWLRVVVVVVIVFGGFVYFTQFHNLLDDQRVVDAIRADPRVKYANVELGGITLQRNFDYRVLYPDFPHLRGYWVRVFYAWEYPKDSVPLSENVRIFGLIDGGMEITIIDERRGDFLYY
jgi:hypothetical protein